jgi:hypothetical protein
MHTEEDTSQKNDSFYSLVIDPKESKTDVHRKPAHGCLKHIYS